MPLPGHGSSACRLAFSMNSCVSVAILSCSRNGAESPTMVGAVGDARRVDQFGKVSGETGVPDPQNEQVGCFATPANRYRFVLIGRPPLCLFFFGKPYRAMAVSAHTHTTHRIASYRSFLRIYISMCFFGFFFHRRYGFVEEHECSTSFQRRATTPEWYFDYTHIHTLLRKTGPFLLVLDLWATDTSKGVHITVYETRDPQQRNPQLKFNSTNQGGKKIPPPIPERIHSCKNEKRKTSTRTEKEQIMGMSQEPSRTQKSPHVTNFN